MRTAHFTALYTPPVVVWVEDELTRDYLEALWADGRFRIAPAGNAGGVGAMVGDALADHLSHVFGVCDRDFRPSNHAAWGLPNIFVFRVPAHEIENYLLDPAAIESCVYNTAARTVPEIDNELMNIANSMVCWMACRTVISEIRERFFSDFIAHPKLANVGNLVQARDSIANDSWYTNLQVRANTILPVAQIDVMLNAAHMAMLADIASGNWRLTFSGKELFQAIHRFVYPHAVQIPPQPTGVQRDVEVAKAVAARQVHLGIPPDLTDLYQTIKIRRGLP
jgi:hypothetical protein